MRPSALSLRTSALNSMRSRATRGEIRRHGSLVVTDESEHPPGPRAGLRSRVHAIELRDHQRNLLVVEGRGHLGRLRTDDVKLDAEQQRVVVDRTRMRGTRSE